MGNIARHGLVAAVSNACGLGTISGASLTPKMLRKEIHGVALLDGKVNLKFVVGLVRALRSLGSLQIVLNVRGRWLGMCEKGG